MSNPNTAALLSFIIPGVGQIYNGKFLRGLFWLIITPGFWIGTGGLLGWVCHFIAAYTAYQYAKHSNLTGRQLPDEFFPATNATPKQTPK